MHDVPHAGLERRHPHRPLLVLNRRRAKEDLIIIVSFDHGVYVAHLQADVEQTVDALAAGEGWGKRET